MSVHKVIGPVFLKETHYDYYLKLTLTQLSEELREGENMQDKPHSLQELKDNIQREVTNSCKQELCWLLRNVFRRCDACLEAGG